MQTFAPKQNQSQKLVSSNLARSHRATPRLHHGVNLNLHLQRTIGNQAVLRMLHAGQTEAPMVHEALRSPGQSLDSATRGFMESRFGRDFSHVRIHADKQSADSARAINARAYTLGSHIVFGSAQYAPTSPNGKSVLAHELAHVVQQTGHLRPRATHVDSGRDAEMAASRASTERQPEVALQTDQPRLQFWRGAYAGPQLIEYLMATRHLSRPAAEAMAREFERQAPGSLATVYPGLASGHYDYDIQQALDIRPGGLNCFGDVCGRDGPWEPTRTELEQWLSANNYRPTSSRARVRGQQRIAVYWIRFTVRAAGVDRPMTSPIHITEQLEDGRWRSRLGGMGVMFHERADQLVSRPMAEQNAAQIAARQRGTVSGSVTVSVTVYARPRPPQSRVPPSSPPGRERPRRDR